MPAAGNDRIYTVSRLNAEVRLLLENEMGVIWLTGEISNFTAPVSGHWYFSLKDSRSQVKCAMFRGNNRNVAFKPTSGQQVLVRARISLYEPRGDYQIIVDSMQPEGNGLLQQQFEKLKMQLAAEGMFAQERKKELPASPVRVGIITSQTGAALRDILQVLQRRDPSLPVVIYPTMVQGDGAAISIAQAIGRANIRNECDVLIVGRGGGSIEDLWCFNEEIVARSIAASSIPVISAVGHEIDVTISDYVADVRAPTPSAAAELVSRDTGERVKQLNYLKDRLNYAIQGYLSRQEHRVGNLRHRLQLRHPKTKLEQQIQQLDERSVALTGAVQRYMQNKILHIDRQSLKLSHYSPERRIESGRDRIADYARRLQSAMERNLAEKRHALALQVETLEAVSPLATLSRGYSITRKENGKVVKSVNDVESGQLLVTQVADGEITSKIVSP